MGSCVILFFTSQTLSFYIILESGYKLLVLKKVVLNAGVFYFSYHGFMFELLI